MRRANCSTLDYGTIWKDWHYFSLLLSSRSQFAKISNKKIKKSSLKINVKNIKTRVYKF